MNDVLDLLRPKVLALGTMIDHFGGVWSVAMTLNSPSIHRQPRTSSKVAGKWVKDPPADPDLQPKVILSSDGGTHGLEYHAATLVNAAAKGRGFFIADYSHGQGRSISFSQEQAAQIAQLIRDAVPRAIGEFRVTWQPDDPTLPF